MMDAYGNNNPVKYNDPSGHCIGPYLVVCIAVGVVVVAAVVVYEASLYHTASTPSNDCTLADCFKNHERRVFQDHEKISEQEFDDLLKVTAKDIDKPLRTRNDFQREAYDTPFYTGGSDQPNQVVCVEGSGCYHQNEINYVAQGMYTAQAGGSLQDAIDDTTRYSTQLYPNDPIDGKLYWAEYGYNFYQKYKDKKKQEN
jgi:hypothetical protein